MIKQLHNKDMKACITFNGQLFDEPPGNIGVKQGDILAPTLFSVFFATLQSHAFHTCDKGIILQFRSSG